MIRIGHFEFLNGFPLYHGLVQNDRLRGLKLVEGVPTELNRKLLAGELDISPISSIEYANHADELLLFPEVSITADGAVDSILLVSNCQVESIRSLALTGQSATSVVLLKILLKEQFGITPECVPLTGGWEEALKQHDAALLIGDQALEAFHFGFWRWAYDLAAGWKDLTGLPMVFAVWAVRQEFFEAHPDETREVQERLLASIRHCRDNFDEMVEAAAETYPFKPTLLRSYFDKLRYDFTNDYRQGLMEFYRRAAELGEAPAGVELNFI